MLSHGGSHGYAIAEVLRRYGFTRIKGVTLYPLLKRLEDQGLVEHTWHHDQAGQGASSSGLQGRAARSWSVQQQPGAE